MAPTTIKNGLYALIFVGVSILAIMALNIKSRKKVDRTTPPASTRPSPSSAHRQKISYEEQVEISRKSSLVLKDLIQSHPDRSIREDFNKMIVNGKVFLNSQENVVGENNIAAVTWINTPTHGNVLTFAFSPSNLMDNTISHRLKQLVIYHEYQHVLQQLDHAHKAGLPKPKPGETLSMNHLRRYFEIESEAYEKESQLAVQLGWQDEFPLCKTYAEQGLTTMRVQLAESLAQNMPHVTPYREVLIEFAKQPPLRR